MKTQPNRQLVCAIALAAVALVAQSGTAQDNLAHGSAPPEEARPHVHIKQDAANPAATASPTGFSPLQIRQAYGFDQLPGSIDGTGQTIAIVDAFGDRYGASGHGNKGIDATQGDWNTFCTQFDLPTGGLTVVYPQGQGNVSTNWALETALDIQWAHAIAPGAKILLVISYDNSLANLFAAVDYAVTNGGASVVSMSWGGGEVNALANDFHFKHPGVTFVASSGDGGEGVIYPASSAYVVSVGGTTLTNISGTWVETAWSGSGGGISSYVPMPSFQSGWQQFDTGNMRSTPDVSYTGGPGSAVSVYSAANGGWVTVYGTSVGAPQWAALLGLANSASSAGPLNSANSILYSVASASATPPMISTEYFTDIASGTNGADADDFAVAGYDFVTGLGSPKANYLVPALISILTTPDFYLSVAPSSATIPSAGGTANYTVTINPLAGFVGPVDLTLAAGLPAGASATFSPPVNDASTLTVTVAPGTAVGSYPLTITGSAASNPSHTVGATLVVASAPSTVGVVSIGYSSSGRNLLVTFTLKDNFGSSVAGASVSNTLYLNGAYYSSATASTLTDGTVTFLARNAPAGTYTTAVTGVTATGLTWDGITPANSFTK
jgi:subtilase family serine protease